MTQSELEQAATLGNIKVDKTDIIQQADSQAPRDLGQPNLADFLPILFALRAPRKHFASDPTFVPKSLLDQIQLYDDGTNRRLYLYINKTWRYVALT